MRQDQALIADLLTMPFQSKQLPMTSWKKAPRDDRESGSGGLLAASAPRA
jgi:hypothetical protein